ncbi:unnamed protein product [Fraxinus pennsylvanica]|uniref:Uncharacterized protein n=1 Tax=Fraxinus pennsylvanica TaxID=56036 RepID=A0AAD1ZTZ2_9LAMI|nr:unnamed protein product [Fraxinus pennsylvanica]
MIDAYNGCFEDCRSVYGIRFKLCDMYNLFMVVTSSLEKKEQELKAEKEKASVEDQQKEEKTPDEARVAEGNSILRFRTSKSTQSENFLEETKCDMDNVNVMNMDVASLMATIDSVTAVVAAKGEVKQAVADDLNSAKSSPCEWFACNDDQSATRFFVIQGSESLASWQANLLFEPVKFEGLDVLVHRGIYEAAKGTYEQGLKSHGDRAKF